MGNENIPYSEPEAKELDSIIGVVIARAFTCSKCNKLWVFGKQAKGYENRGWRSHCCNAPFSRMAEAEMREVL